MLSASSATASRAAAAPASRQPPARPAWRTFLHCACPCRMTASTEPSPFRVSMLSSVTMLQAVIDSGVCSQLVTLMVHETQVGGTGASPLTAQMFAIHRHLFVPSA